MLIALEDAPNKCTLIHPKQERIETNGDGVKPGSPPAGHGGANVQIGRIRPSLNIFTPSPFVSELYAHSCNTRSEAACVLKRKIECASLNMGVLFPLLPFGLSSPTREEFRPPKMRDMLFVHFDKV